MGCNSQGQARSPYTLSRERIKDLIEAGQHIVIFQQNVLKLDAWLKYHPGGEKAIQHFVGRDATDEIIAFHSQETLKLAKLYQIGVIRGPWENLVPPIQRGDLGLCKEPSVNFVDTEDTVIQEKDPQKGPTFGQCWSLKHSNLRSTAVKPGVDIHDLDRIANTPTFLDICTRQELSLDRSRYPLVDPMTQDQIVEKYRKLHEDIKMQGLYDCAYSSYLLEGGRCLLVFSLCIIFLIRGWYITSSIFLSMFWHLLVFIVHDAAHTAITHNYTFDSLIAMTIASCLGGLSAGWWKRNHNIHHLVTNSPEHDPDISYVPFFATSHRFFTSLTSTFYEHVMSYDMVATILIRVQHLLYYPIMCVARFNLYRLSWTHLARGLGPRKGTAWWHRWYEIAGIGIFWLWFGYGIVYCTIPTMKGRITFVLCSHAAAMPLHVLFTLSHFAMSTTDLGLREAFAQKMLRTTMDIDCPPWFDFWYGGLQFQAVHHLFPRVPRHNLRAAQSLVKSFCEDVGIPYALYGFVDVNKHVLGRLKDVAQQAAIFEECRKKTAESIMQRYTDTK